MHGKRHIRAVIRGDFHALRQLSHVFVSKMVFWTRGPLLAHVSPSFIRQMRVFERKHFLVLPFPLSYNSRYFFSVFSHLVHYATSDRGILYNREYLKFFFTVNQRQILSRSRANTFLRMKFTSVWAPIRHHYCSFEWRRRLELLIRVGNGPGCRHWLGWAVSTHDWRPRRSLPPVFPLSNEPDKKLFFGVDAYRAWDKSDWKFYESILHRSLNFIKWQ